MDCHSRTFSAQFFLFEPMKTPWFAVLLLISTVIGTQAQVATASAANLAGADLPAPTPYAVVSRDAHSRVWERTVYESSPSGQAIPSKHRYVELSTGLHFWQNGQWQESQEQIGILPQGGAAATNGAHQVYFPGDIFQGEIQLVTPDGKQLQSRPIGLSYDDGAKTVLIAVLTNSVGQLVGPNQVLYLDAFTGLKADLRYTYTKAGLEQDIILREQPLTPESYGLNPATARLQVLTEFFNPPPPAVSTTVLPEQAGIILTDENLDFGAMKMMPGRAFLLGSDAHEGGASVSKSWVMLEGRQFLVEEVPVEALANELAQLPALQTTSIKPNANSLLRAVSAKRLLPSQRLSKSIPSGPFKQVAQTAPPSRGLVLDYQTLNGSLTDYTFQGDTTYYISGPVYLPVGNCFEAGTVIKYATNTEISIGSTNLSWLASVYRPVIFTAMDDNSVGETIYGSTGNPSGYYANPALSFYLGSHPALSNFRISYAGLAISAADVYGTLVFYNAQFVNCQLGFELYESTANLNNALFANVQTNFLQISGGAVAQNTTFNNANYLVVAYGSGSGVKLTNCILANVTNLYFPSPSVNGSYNGFYRSPMFGTGTVTNAFYPFQAAGLGNYYLANGCNFTNKGTTNIDATLLTQLAQKTTCPPIVYSNVTISVPTNLSPQVQRNIGTPDLGYHYDPLDYIFNNTMVNANLTFGAGTAAGWFTTPAATGGLLMATNTTIAFSGTVAAPDYWVDGYTVQEGGGTPGGSGSGIVSTYSMIPSQFVQARFTRFSALAADQYFLSTFGSTWMTNCGSSTFVMGKKCFEGTGSEATWVDSRS